MGLAVGAIGGIKEAENETGMEAEAGEVSVAEEEGSVEADTGMGSAGHPPGNLMTTKWNFHN